MGAVLIACCIYYGQTEARMARLIASLAGKCDAAVFLAGPYRGLSDDVTRDEALYPFLADRCEEAGIQYAIFGGEIYDSEPAKRTAALQAARLYTWAPLEQRRNEALGQEKWGLIIDSDEWLDSDHINWALIEQAGTGTIKLENWDGDVRAPDREGEGATMVRIVPLLGGMVYGPAHYDLMDSRSGIVFSGHDKGLGAPNPPCAVFGHDVGAKTIAAEYEAYNDAARATAEGKLLRISEVADDGTFVVVKMDKEQAARDWPLGNIAAFPAQMLPAGTVPEGQEQLQAILDKIEPSEESPDVVDLYMVFISDAEVARIVAERQAIAAEQSRRDQMLLEHRRRKQERKAAKRQRIAESQSQRRWT